MARLILERECEHGWLDAHLDRGTHDDPWCPGGSRIIVDPSDLPSYVIEAAAQGTTDAHFGTIPGDVALILAEAALKAGLAQLVEEKG